MYKRQSITKDELERLCTSGKFDKLDYDYIIPSITDDNIFLYKEDGVPIAIMIDGLSTQGIREIFYFEVSNEEVGKGHGTRLISEYLQEHREVEVISLSTSVDFWTKPLFNPTYSNKIFKFIKEDIEEEGDSIYLLQVRLNR